MPAALAALRHRDFRLFWFGALVSFTGSWVATFGQQALVWHLTGSKFKLGFITFLAAAPMFFSPLFGWVADRCDKRVTLVLCQISFALTAFVLFLSLVGGWASYELLCALALFNGITAVIEIPTRQSLISRVVPPEDIANAIPLNAAAFNGARIIGPAIGGVLLSVSGYATLYLINSLSFLALILAIVGIRSDLKAQGSFTLSIRETLLEGVRYVAIRPGFRILVLMLMTNSLFGLCYFSQLAAYAKGFLLTGDAGLSKLMTLTGIGALIGLWLMASLSPKPYKGWIPLVSMFGFSVSLLCLSYATAFLQAAVCCAFLGMFGAGHMAGTNTALQYYSPPDLRGRVVSVHAWALGGIWPIGALLLGHLAESFGLINSLRVGGCVVFAVSALALLFAHSVKRLE